MSLALALGMMGEMSPQALSENAATDAGQADYTQGQQRPQGIQWQAQQK
jgi:hypothetical protein